MSPGQVRFSFDIYPRKIAWIVLRASVLIHKVHSSAKVIPVDRVIGSLEKDQDTIKVEYLIIKE